MGPFPKAVGNKKYLLVCTNYFTKWVEAEPLANIRDMDAKKFIWKNIVTRFKVPYTLISDNGLQFIVRLSGDTVVTWESPIGIPFLPTPKEMDRLELLIRS